MIPDELKVKLILEALYMKICNCRRDYEELEDNLHPTFHLEECPYRLVIEREDIQWKTETQTQDS